MKHSRIGIIVVLTISSTTAAAQSVPNPYGYTCQNYLSAKSPAERQQAAMIASWAVGYLQGRLGRLKAAKFSGETFPRDVGDVNGTLMKICQNVPDMPVATFMNNLAGDFEKSNPDPE
jgi:hypothetical protein